jgi:hypothetical protein
VLLATVIVGRQPGDVDVALPCLGAKGSSGSTAGGLTGSSKLAAQALVPTTSLVAVSAAALGLGGTRHAGAENVKGGSPPGYTARKADRLSAQVLGCCGCQGLAGSSDRVRGVGSLE